MLFVIAALYVAVAVALPIIIRLKTRLEKPTFREALLNDASMPPQARTELVAFDAPLRALEFEPRGMIALLAGTAPAMYLALYRNQQHGARALARAVVEPGASLPARQSSDVELAIPSQDGTSVELSTIGNALPGVRLVPGHEAHAGKIVPDGAQLDRGAVLIGDLELDVENDL